MYIRPPAQARCGKRDRDDKHEGLKAAVRKNSQPQQGQYRNNERHRYAVNGAGEGQTGADFVEASVNF